LQGKNTINLQNSFAHSASKKTVGQASKSVTRVKESVRSVLLAMLRLGKECATVVLMHSRDALGAIWNLGVPQS
jgi:hypothetical protein